MISVGTFLISILVTAIVTAVVTVFVYRNNVGTIGKVVDKIDDVHDVLKE